MYLPTPDRAPGEAHFVTFYGPGTLYAETREAPIDNWDADAAMKIAGDKPYAFRFSTRDSHNREIRSSTVAWIIRARR